MTTTVNRSLADCAQRVVNREDEIARLEKAEAYYRKLVDPADPDGTKACAHEAHRLRQIRLALTQP